VGTVNRTTSAVGELFSSDEVNTVVVEEDKKDDKPAIPLAHSLALESSNLWVGISRFEYHPAKNAALVHHV